MFKFSLEVSEVIGTKIHTWSCIMAEVRGSKYAN